MSEQLIVHAPEGSHMYIPQVLPSWPKIDLLLTDPPYGMDFQSSYGKKPKDREKYQAKIEADTDVATAIADFTATLRAVYPFLADECEIYIFSDWKVCPEWQTFLRDLAPHGFPDLKLMQLIIWEKGWPGLGDFENWGQGHEFIYYLKRGSRMRTAKRRSGVIHVDKVLPGKNIHPTEKPQKLLRELIEWSSDPGDFVFDPYAGSGSTVLAALNSGRKALGMERDVKYLPAARARLPRPDMDLMNLFTQ